MNSELREDIGKAIYVSLTLEAIPWDRLSEVTKEEHRLCGDKAIEIYKNYQQQNPLEDITKGTKHKEEIEKNDQEQSHWFH